MSSEIVIAARGLGKVYTIYKKPEDRLKQMLVRWKRYYDEYWALRGVDLVVRRGETLGVIGRNGSGKSTLLQMICGTLQPSEGEVQVTGRIAGLLELGAGFNPEFTGRENVLLAALVLGLTDSEIAERFDSIAEFAGIGEFMEQPVRLYSSGMYARLAFAVAAHVDADILVVDEILAVGDAAFVQKCMRFIRRFRENGTLVFVSHDIGSVMNLCDRVIWIDRGRLREEGSPKEIAHHYYATVDSESDDGSSFHIGGTRQAAPAVAAPVVDAREETLRKVNTQSIELFAFDPDAPWYGRRGATIEKVELLNAQGAATPVIGGGAEVILRIAARAEEQISQVVLGFFIRDRLGQVLFGDNTYISSRDQLTEAAAGDEIRASFRFQMPYLPTGDYSVQAAIAEGTQDDNVQHHWVDDALFFRVHNSHITFGLVGIPMLGIDLDIRAPAIMAASDADKPVV